MKWSVFLFFVEFDLGDGFSLFFELLSFFQVTFSHLFEVFFEKYFSLLSIFSLFPLLKDVLDVFFKLIWMADINKLQSVFNSDAPSSCNIIHQELSQVEKVSGLEPGLVKDAAFIHECEFVLIDGAIEILIDFPNPLIDFGLAVVKVELCQDSDDIFLVELIFGSGLFKNLRVSVHGLLLGGFEVAIGRLDLIATDAAKSFA